MKKLTDTYLNLGFNYNSDEIDASFKEASKDSTFKEIVDSLKIDKKEIKKRTSILKESSKEVLNCKNCKNILECKNKITGYCYKPVVINNTIEFIYEECLYQKALTDKSSYLENIYLYNMPKELKEAKLSDVYMDKPRIELIKWINNFIDNYDSKEPKKGLYLSGNFGSGKTYLIAALFNELAKRNKKSAIIYFPEFLRNLKSSFENGFEEKYDYIKNVELLLIDDIGAENLTSWGRDEILGTILQYRMQEHKTTFFTSNLNIEELEIHLSLTKNSLEEVKAKRIIERIKQLTEDIKLIGKNFRK